MFQFPQPNELANEMSILLTQQEACALLVHSATALAMAECPADANGYCENCNATRALFWSVSNALDGYWRRAYQAHLANLGVPLPDGPWEDVAGDNVEPLPKA